MSDGQRRTSFARPISSAESERCERTSCWESVAEDRLCDGSRLELKKVKGEKKLSHVQLRSSFGGSED
jgi:hypothetical protein